MKETVVNDLTESLAEAGRTATEAAAAFSRLFATLKGETR